RPVFQRGRHPIEASDVEREHELALGKAILGQTKLAHPERDTTCQLRADVKLCRRNENRDDRAAAVQFLPRHHEDWVWAARLEVGHVDFAGANHQYGVSRANWAACLRANARRAACSRSSWSSFCIALNTSAGSTTTSRPSSGAASCTGSPL